MPHQWLSGPVPPTSVPVKRLLWRNTAFMLAMVLNSAGSVPLISLKAMTMLIICLNLLQLAGKVPVKLQFWKYANDSCSHTGASGRVPLMRLRPKSK